MALTPIDQTKPAEEGSQLAENFITYLARHLYEVQKTNMTHPRLGIRTATWEELGDQQSRYEIDVKCFLKVLLDVEENSLPGLPSRIQSSRRDHAFHAWRTILYHALSIPVSSSQSPNTEEKPNIIKRERHRSTDVLLDPVEHPTGTRILLNLINLTKGLDEVTVLEWAPSGERVKLKFHEGVDRWFACKDYEPIVVEVLSPLRNSEKVHEFQDLTTSISMSTREAALLESLYGLMNVIDMTLYDTNLSTAAQQKIDFAKKMISAFEK